VILRAQLPITHSAMAGVFVLDSNALAQRLGRPSLEGNY
jgi:hypothetical protein